MEKHSTWPLIGGQSGIWYAEQLDVAHAAYTTGQCLELKGEFTLSLLAEAIRQTVDECQTLHVRFVDTEQGPCQCSVATERWTLEQQDLRGVAMPFEAARQWMDEQLAQPVDLAVGPLFSQALIMLDECHVLWFSRIHHIVADAYSYGLLQQRAAEIYAALLAQRAPGPAWFGSIETLVGDAQAYACSAQRQQDRQFWLQRLAGDPEPVNLAGRFAAASASAHKHQLALPGEQVEALNRFARSIKASLPEVMLAAIGAYLCRMTGQGDVTLGLPMMGRMQPATLRTPSTQVNVLPLRLPLDQTACVGAWVEATRHEMRDIRRHQRYRYEWLQQDLQRRPHTRPLFGPHVNILPYTQPHLWRGCTTHTHHLATGPVDDMTFSLYLGGDSGELCVALEANPALYSLARTRGHLERFVHWLSMFVRDETAAIASLERVSPREKTLLATWNTTDHEVESTHLATLFERQVAHTPMRTALIFEKERLDYATLNARANQLARRLLDEGVGRGDIVAVAVPRSLELEIALLAVHKAGAAYMPLSSDYPPQRLAYMFEKAAPAALIAASSLLGILPDAASQLRPIPRIVLDAPGMAAALATYPATNLNSDAREVHDPAYLIFTSGSTGHPKGVLVEHHAIVNRLAWMQGQYGLDGSDRVLQKTPSGFDVSVWEFFWPLISGATLVMALPEGHRDPHYLAKLIAREQITTLHFVPSMLSVFLDELNETTAVQLSALKRVFVSGEALSKSLQTRFFAQLNAELHNLYGPTEAAVDVTCWTCEPRDPRTTVPIGRPIWNTQIHILDEQLRQVPIGCVGELYIAGRNLAREYIGRLDLTAERFVPNPFAKGQRMYRSGDLACWNEDGTLEYLGRIDNQVKLRGLRIELDEIEAVLMEQPAVAGAVVSVYRDARIDGVLVAYLVAAEGACEADLEPATLKRQVARKLPDYMIPGQIVLLDELPLTANGKLDRKVLPAPDPGTAGQGNDAPRTPQEALLCTLFAETLGVERVGIHDDFFDLGGHSLLAVQLARRIRERLGWDASIATLFEAPSVARLAEVGHAAHIDDALDVLLPLRQPQDAPTLFCIHPAGGLSWCYSGLTRFVPPQFGVYGLQARGLKGAGGNATLLPTSMDRMARDYLTQLRSVQPQGPYYLLGWSIGGMIAHTMAALLQAEGEDVALLAMLDAYPSDLWRHMAPPGEAEALTALLRIAGFGQHEHEALSRDEVIALLRAEGDAMANLPLATLDVLVEVVINNSRLVRESRHQVFDGDVLFFTAARPRAQTWLTREAWTPYVRGRLDNIDIDCEHPTMLQPDSLGQIGPHLASALAEAACAPLES